MTATAKASGRNRIPGPRRYLAGAASGPTAALLLWAASAIGIAVATHSTVLAWLVVALVPGLALSPFIPIAARRSSASALIAALVASACFWPLAVPLIGLLGIPIGTGSVLGASGILAAICLPASWRYGATARPSGSEAGDWAGLGLALAASGWIATHTFHNPPLGSDWGHYWRFADAIVETGSLDAINASWMGGGLPFGDYPGLPSLLAAWLSLSGLSASATPALVGIVYCAGVAAAWLAVRSCWGTQAAALTGVTAALMPPTIVAVGWSGLAHLLSLVFALPLIATVSVLPFERGAERRRIQLATAVLATAMAAAQPLTAIVIGAALVGYLILCLLRTRTEGLRTLAETAALTVVLAVAVLADYRDRLGKLGVSQDYQSFLTTRVAWTDTLTRGLLPALLVAVAGIGLLVALSSGRTRRLAVVSLIALASAIAYSQAWRLEFAGEYRRSVYLMAPVLAVGVGGLTALGRGLRPSLRLAAAAILIAGVAFTVRAWPAQLESFYLTVTPDAATVVTEVGKRAAASDEAIVADSCWAFPALGLTRAQVYGALEPSQIGPRSEVVPAAKARAILGGGRNGPRIARDLRVRWVIVKPSCPERLATGRSRDGLPAGFLPVATGGTVIVGYRPAN